MMTEIEEVTAKAMAKRKLDAAQDKYFAAIYIPSSFLVVTYNGAEVYMMNKSLLDQQNCWDNLEDIKETHWLKLMFYDMIMDTQDPVELKELAKDIQECEFELQRLWKFDENAKFHRFWETPKCLCPKMDCSDAYPSGRYVIRQDCPLHGV